MPLHLNAIIIIEHYDKVKLARNYSINKDNNTMTISLNFEHRYLLNAVPALCDLYL